MNNIIPALIAIAVSGGFGGFVFGMHSNTSYNIAIPFKGDSVPAGFIGDILVGVAAAITVFFAAGAVFSLKLSETSQPECCMKIIALGVLSGFAGIRLLSGMSGKLVEQLKDMGHRIDEVEKNKNIEELLRDADSLLDKNAMKAKLMYEQAILIDPKNEAAKIGKAKALRRLGKFQDAIALLSKVIERNPKSGRAFYNRACYKNLLTGNFSKEDALDDLQKAIRLYPFYKEYVLEDKDFEDLLEDSAFRQVLASC